MEKLALAPMHIMVKKKLKLVSQNIGICENRTFVFINDEEGKNMKQTGMIISVIPSDKTTAVITYDRRVRRAGLGPKSKKIQFDSPSDLDHFLARLDVIFSRKNIVSVQKNGVYPNITLLVFTWNIGNALPDFNFFNFVCLTARNNSSHIILFSGQESNEDDTLFKNFDQALGDSYVSIVQSTFWQIRLGVWVSRSIQSAVTEVFSSQEGTGVLGFMGNKGAIGATFKIFGSPIAFIASHLAAHQGHINERNQNFRKIVTSMDIGIPQPLDLISGFHHIVWAGDLNYRIDRDFQTVVSCADDQNYDRLLPFDQLKNQQSLGAVFGGFSEGPITFHPTYKFKRHTSTYDKDSTRIPAWCDRVLIRSFPGLEKRCLQYSCSDSVTTSDHHPVYALWSLNVVATPSPPPPFASAIGIKPYIEFSSVIVNRAAKACFLTFWSPFLAGEDGKMGQFSSAVGKGRREVIFPDETIPLLIPALYADLEYMKTLYVHIIISLDDAQYVAVLPLSFMLVNVFRPFCVPFGKGVEVFGNISGNLRLIQGNVGSIEEHMASHLKADPKHHFETRIPFANTD